MSSKIYFPITRKDADYDTFKSIVGKNIPGLLKERPDLLEILESVQPFKSQENIWLSDFASLCNKSKHQCLSTINCNYLDTIIYKDREESSYKIFSYSSEGREVPTKMPLLLLTPKEGQRCYDCKNYNSCNDCDISYLFEYTATYIVFDEIDKEFLYFLNKCVSGVENIVVKISEAI